MLKLKRASNEKELQRLISIFLKAETDIINEIARLRSQGLVDYHAVAALERVQAILQSMESDCWTYVPKMIEEQFYVRAPEARRIPETKEKHQTGYSNAMVLTSEQIDVVNRLTMNLMGEITEASAQAMSNLQSAIIGRTTPDIYRQVGLEQVAAIQATGRSLKKALPDFIQTLHREGVTAFVDRAGRRWSLHTYCSMVTRTTSRQAEILSVLTADPQQDLYQISSHNTVCKICAPLEGRVYSKSGTDPDFPPLSAAFGKVVPDGPDTLMNTWLNIHPNCLHAIIPWTPAGRSTEEIQKIKEFSSPKTNPFTKDPRTEQQIKAYRRKEQARAQWLRDYRQWERYRMTIPEATPKTFATFQKHKLANDDKYQGWMQQYRKKNFIDKYSKVRYHENGTVVVTDVWKEHRSIPNVYRPNAVVETQFEGGQIDRIFYDNYAQLIRQVHSGNHGNAKMHPYGDHGEHGHDFIRDDSGKLIGRVQRELKEWERKENADIL